MSLMELLKQVTALQREVDNTAAMIESFLKDGAQNMALVQSELKGSSKGHDMKMMNALRQAEDSLKQSLQLLQQASKALLQVQAV